jgi:hypothetical protein
MNKSYVGVKRFCFTSPAFYCYVYLDYTDGNIRIYIIYFLFQLGAFRIQNLQRTRVENMRILPKYRLRLSMLFTSVLMSKYWKDLSNLRKY